MIGKVVVKTVMNKCEWCPAECKHWEPGWVVQADSWFCPDCSPGLDLPAEWGQDDLVWTTTEAAQ